MTVWGRSKTATIADLLYCTPITKTWDDPILASDLVDELRGSLSVDFLIEDFLIPAGILSAEKQTSMEIIHAVADRSQGAIVRSDKDGTLVIRPRYATKPESIPTGAR